MRRSHDIAGTPLTYVAISHVWGDGTSNPNQNALPACQLSKFQDAVNQLYDATLHPVPFQIDTICVPTDKELKKLAIRQMVNVYREADKVLVFDSTLPRISVDASPAECLTAIEISAWMRRLWAIQEAAFARQLYFRFKDGASMIEDLQLQHRLKRFLRLSEMMSPTKVEDHGPWTIVLARQLLPAMKSGTDESTFQSDNTIRTDIALDDIELTGLQLDEIFYSPSISVGSLNLLRFPTKGLVSQREIWNWLQNTLPNRQN
jgi:hypothetical protein